MRTRLADYHNPTDLDLVISLLDVYSQDPMGTGKPLSEDIKTKLRKDLPSVPGAFSIVVEDGDAGLGVAICFMGYSTFGAKPIVNVHDLSVNPDARGRGVGKALLDAVAGHARSLGCGKVTLEVRDDNPAARLYRREGFTDGDAPMRFLTKTL